MVQHARVVGTRTAGARREEVGRDVLAAPGRLDQQDLVLDAVAHDHAEAELRPDQRTVRAALRAKAHRQLALPPQEPDPDVLADRPGAVLLLQPVEQVTMTGILAQVVEGVDRALALHVRLACKEEDLQRSGGIRGDPVRVRQVDQPERDQQGCQQCALAHEHVSASSEEPTVYAAGSKPAAPARPAVYPKLHALAPLCPLTGPRRRLSPATRSLPPPTQPTSP